IPAAPFVGAVTTLPPAAFSSFTAIANVFTQSIGASASSFFSAASFFASRGARLRTFNPPGKIPSVESPRLTHSCITLQIRSTCPQIPASACQFFSLPSPPPQTPTPRPPPILNNPPPLKKPTGAGFAFLPPPPSPPPKKNPPPIE